VIYRRRYSMSKEMINVLAELNNRSRKYNWKKIILKTALLLTLGLGVFYATQWTYEPSSYRVIGTSMFPSLLDGDTCLLINRDFGKLSIVKRNDIVAFEDSTIEKLLVKRVVGLPGDTIEFRAGRLLVNGKEEFLPALLINLTIGGGKTILGPDEYFVLGDNRKNSYDSRHFGPISRGSIVGIVILRWRSLNVH
jgi:signal peptidase I